MSAPQRLKVLFVCIHNSARSQMAETFLNQLGGKWFHAESAGLQPGQLNPVVVEAMREIGIDISGRATRSVDETLRSGQRFDVVVTVCDEASAEQCPVFPGSCQHLHWPFPDPSALVGDRSERLAGTRTVRDAIRAHIEVWVAQNAPSAGAFDVGRSVSGRQKFSQPVRIDSPPEDERPVV